MNAMECHQCGRALSRDNTQHDAESFCDACVEEQESMNEEPTINERYAAYVADIGTQAHVAKLLGIGVKTVNARCGNREIKPEAMFAIIALHREEKRKAVTTLTGATAVYADGTEGKIVYHDPVEGPVTLLEDGAIIIGGEFKLKQETPS